MPMGDALPGEHKLPENLARLVKTFQMFQELTSEPELRKAFPVVAALWLMFAQDAYSEIALHQFGTRELNVDQGFMDCGCNARMVRKDAERAKTDPDQCWEG